LQYTFKGGIGFTANYEHGLTRLVNNLEADIYGSSARFAITYKY
jgi:hypothetical protein